MIIFGLNPCLRCCRRSAWNHHAFFLRLAYKDLSSKLIHVNRVSSSPAPRASKLLRRLRSHSLRSEAALKVFFGYMPHLSLFLSEQIQQNNLTMINKHETVATNLTLRASLKRGSREAGEICYCQLLCKAACYYEQSCLYSSWQ